MKFEGEFDFEQANARFEQEIEKEFTDKLKISTKPHQQSQQTNDTSLNQQYQDLQDQQHMLMKQKSLTTTLDSDVKQEQHTMSQEEKNFYDKNISFFDRISCEANEKNQSKPKNWKEERKMNAETFGLQQRNQADMKFRSYNNYNSQNYRNNNNSNNQNGRNYPRSVNNTNGRTNNNNPRYSNNQRMTVGNGNGNSNGNSRGYNSTNYRRNDMEVSYNSRNGQRRFGSR